MRRRPLALLLTVVGVLLLGTALPAAADPARPTNYRSSVTAIDPTIDGLEVEIVGGDAYVVVRAPAGSLVEVPGYPPAGEPFVRIRPDGTVERNEASPTRWISDERYGGVEVPGEASAAAPPVWEVVGTDGEYAWHDHRVHWMSPRLPDWVDPGVDRVQPVQDWTLELSVDGTTVTVAGELVWTPGPGPLVAVPLGLVAVALGSLLGWVAAGRAPLWAAAGALLAGAGGLGATVGLPAGADPDLPVVLLPGAALFAAAVTVWARRHRPAGAAWFGALAGVPLLVWVAFQAGALTRPIVPGVLPIGVVRGLVAAVAALGIATVVAAVRAFTERTAPGDRSVRDV